MAIGGEDNKEVKGVSMGTMPTVFKWKTIRNPCLPMDKMKPDGKKGTAELDAVHFYTHNMHRCYPAHAHPHTASTRYKQIRETTTGKDK